MVLRSLHDSEAKGVPTSMSLLEHLAEWRMPQWLTHGDIRGVATPSHRHSALNVEAQGFRHLEAFKLGMRTTRNELHRQTMRNSRDWLIMIAARCWVYSLLSLLDDLPIVTHNRRLGKEKRLKTQGSRLDWPSYSYSLYVPERSCHWASESPDPRSHWPHFMQLIWKKKES